MDIIKNSLPDRRVPHHLARELVSRIPMKVLREARAHHMNINQEQVNEMLEHIGIDPICDMVSQGCFVYDVAIVLDIPPLKVLEWLKTQDIYAEKIEAAETISAEAHLSEATHELMTVHSADVDSIKVAKIKAEHLKWLASRKDRNKYGDHVSHKHSGSSSVEYRISLVSPSQGNIIQGN